MNRFTQSTSNQITFGKLRKFLLKGLFFLIVSCFFIGIGNAQGWEKTYGLGTGKIIKQTQDANLLVASDSSVLKIDLNGDVLWSKKYSIKINDLELATDGGFFIACGDSNKATLIKCNSLGNIVSEKHYGNDKPSYFNSIEPTKDGGYILGGKSNVREESWTEIGYYPNGTTFNINLKATIFDIYIVKTDNNGDSIWTKSITDTLSNDYKSWNKTFGFSEAQEIIEVADGYIINSKRLNNTRHLDSVQNNWSWSMGSNSWTSNYLRKISFSGDDVWCNYDLYHIIDINKCNDGNIAMIFYEYDTIALSFYPYFIKMDLNGNTISSFTIKDDSYSYFSSIFNTSDGGYLITGSSEPTNTWKNNINAIKINSECNYLWSKQYGDDIQEYGNNGIQITDGSFVYVGSKKISSLKSDIYVIKTDKLGNTKTNTISGTAFIDINGNCIKDSTDIPFKNQLIKLEPNNIYTRTDSTGFYSFLADSGSFTVSLINPTPNMIESCPNSSLSFIDNFNSNNYKVSDSNDFALLITNYCPDLYIDLSTWLIRRCRRNTYTVNYSNHGTATANNAYAEITFDPSIIVLSSSIPWSSKVGNTYRFDLGDIATGESGSFYITDSVDCNATLGATLCTEAIIYPNQPCTVDSLWDKSSITLTGECVGDSATCFTIHNNNMSMTGTSEYRIYVNDMLVVTQRYQLAANDNLQVCYAANGNTIRFEADQRPNHPGNSHPKKIIEGCGGNTVLGSINTVAQDDEDNFKAIFCGTIMGSFDPNDKSVKPEGITEYRYIHSTDELTYHINFQNTGNDTAFVIVVKDTLSEFLDPKTVVSGASSHPYTFKTYGSGILEWTFNNIMLADSNVNEAMSHGFIEFRVKQKANNPQNTIIRNTAAIYFDYNAPVMTNEVWNMVHDAELVSSCKTAIYNNSINIDAYPNPFSESITIEVKSSNKNFEYPITFEMYDLLGKEIKSLVITDSKLQIERDGMPSGMYYFKVKCREEILGAGKIVVK